jgi:hypothetical protein
MSAVSACPTTRTSKKAIFSKPTKWWRRSAISRSREKRALFSGVLFVTLIVLGSRSVKDRRSVTKSLLDRIRSRWNVSAMDLGPDGSRSKVFLGVSAVASDAAMAEERLETVFSFLCGEEESGEFTIIHHWREVTGYDELSDAKNQQADAEGNFTPPGTAGKE